MQRFETLTLHPLPLFFALTLFLLSQLERGQQKWKRQDVRQRGDVRLFTILIITNSPAGQIGVEKHQRGGEGEVGADQGEAGRALQGRDHGDGD